MPLYLAILRGINVSGKNKIKMEDLRGLLTNLRLEQVQTYIQSGNVVFATKATDNAQLAQQIKQAIADAYGFDVPVLVKQKEELDRIIAQSPFASKQEAEIKALHVTFLAETPSTERVAEIDKDAYLPDEWRLQEEAIYLYCPNGYGRTKLTNTFFERKLKVVATTRNWKTTLKLQQMLEEV